MLRDDLQKTLKDSMLARDADTTGAVRLIIAGMKEKDVEARGKGQEKASDADLLAMMQNMIKQRNDSIKMYNDGNRPDLAEKEAREICERKSTFNSATTERKTYSPVSRCWDCHS